MKERPILFSAPMVRAILDGRKTQTRRIAKFKFDPPDGFYPDRYNKGEQWTFWGPRGTDKSGQSCLPYLKCPYGQPGDRLWVRETWACSVITMREMRGVQYLATYKDDDAWNNVLEIRDCWPSIFQDWHRIWDKHGQNWRPSIHMPRWASRITLEVTAVQVERLQDISEADAIAEGIEEIKDNSPFGNHGLWRDYSEEGSMPFNRDAPVSSYRTLWESINGPGSWDANPWVWVVEFKVIK